ncbi:MAG: hypothetical protein NC248_04610 [Bacteroides sp.]|nr:hypothetical protein [Bacteroides sp.]MCM1388922.1 hypothetical protein [Bacteroides sp.]
MKNYYLHLLSFLSLITLSFSFSACSSDSDDEPEIVYDAYAIWELIDNGDLTWEAANAIVDNMNEQLGGANGLNVAPYEYSELAKLMESEFKQNPADYKATFALAYYFRNDESDLPDGWQKIRDRNIYTLDHGSCKRDDDDFAWIDDHDHDTYRIWVEGNYETRQKLGKYYADTKKIHYRRADVVTFGNGMMQGIVNRLNSGEQFTDGHRLEIRIYNDSQQRLEYEYKVVYDADTKQFYYNRIDK